MQPSCSNFKCQDKPDSIIRATEDIIQLFLQAEYVIDTAMMQCSQAPHGGVSSQTINTSKELPQFPFTGN